MLSNVGSFENGHAQLVIHCNSFFSIVYLSKNYENKKLQHLNIGQNKIGDDGVRHVTEGIQRNNTLTELLLWECEISVKGSYITNY